MGLYLILMGVQGAGKGEQAKFIESTYGIPQVSTGDLFRAMKTRTDELAQRIQQIMAAGNLIDDDTTNEVVRERLSQPDAANGVILDGYPRTPAQADWLENYLNSRGEKVGAVLLFEIDLYTAFKRAFGRVKSSKTGETFNIYSNAGGIKSYTWEESPDKRFPPRLVAIAADGEELARRPDDASADAIIKRIDTFLKTTQPLIDHYKRKGLLKVIPAERSIEEVSAEVKRIIDAVK